MALEAVKIPADVQVEEKIVGPIGLRQLGMLMGGGGVGYVIWSVCQQNGYTGAGAMLAAWLPFIISGTFAFLKINDISLFRLCLLAFEKSKKPPVRVFSPRVGINITVKPGAAAQYSASKKKNKQQELDQLNQKKQSIQELSAVLDKGLNDLVEPRPAPPTAEQVEQELRRVAVEKEEEQTAAPDAEPLSGKPMVDDISSEEQPKANGPMGGPNLMHDIMPPA